MKFKKKYIPRAMMLCIIALLFSGCTKKTSNDLMKMMYDDDSLSVDYSREVIINYTDSGILRARIHTPEMMRFANDTNPYTEMPMGVDANFFNDAGVEQSQLTAKYAISYEKRDLIYIKDSVVIHNINDEEIRTDELYWDKTKRFIYSDKNVRIRIRDEKILVGEGFESNETFTKYKIKQLTGVVNLKNGPEF